MDEYWKEEAESLRLRFEYIDEYINKKYEQICQNVLNTPTKTYSGISFSSFFDKLFFIFLYEESKYNSLLEEIRPKVYQILRELDSSEVDMLFSRCLNKVNEGEIQQLHDNTGIKHFIIASEVIVIANRLVFQHLTDVRNPDLKSYVNELKDEIENFAYSGAMEGDDYEINSYWEEFCFQIQYGDGAILDIILDDIDSHLNKKLNKESMKEVILLFTTTDEYCFGDYQIHDYLDLYSKDEMIEFIKKKLIEEIKWIASQTPIPDFSTGETWDD